MTEAKARDSNLGTYDNSVFSVASTRNLGTSVLARGLGGPEEQSSGRGQLG